MPLLPLWNFISCSRVKSVFMPLSSTWSFQVFLLKPCKQFFSSSLHTAAFPANLIVLDLSTWVLELSKNRKASFCVVFSNILLPPLSQDQIFPSVSYCAIPPELFVTNCNVIKVLYFSLLAVLVTCFILCFVASAGNFYLIFPRCVIYS